MSSFSVSNILKILLPYLFGYDALISGYLLKCTEDPDRDNSICDELDSMIVAIDADELFKLSVVQHNNRKNCTTTTSINKKKPHPYCIVLLRNIFCFLNRHIIWISTTTTNKKLCEDGNK